MIGQILSHYQVLEKLGEGGMGVVYRAKDTRLNRSVALKVLPHDAMADPQRRERFVHEARAASALSHPNIITVYEVDSAGGVDFIAMEHVTGRTLAQLVDPKGLKLSDALTYAVQIADALATAHAAGIVHRDLKPANVMITDAGRVKVLDFGLAKLVDPVDVGDSAETRRVRPDPMLRTEPGTILGTVAYMSPEQAEGRPVDARSDIFSFGSLLYEMVTGRRAFAGETRVSTLSAILEKDPEPASGIAAGVPRELDRIIAQCLRKSPAQRFQHLDDVKVTLEGLIDDLDTQKLLVGRRGASLRSRYPPAVAAAAVLLVVAVASVGWWWIRRPEPTTAPETAAPSATGPGAAARPRLSTGGPASLNAEANRLFENAMQAVMAQNDVPKGRLMFERALDLDPHFAEARAWHGFTNWLLVDYGQSNDRALLAAGEEEMRRALEDEPSLARAHMGFAAIYLMEGRKELMPAELEQVEKTNPGDKDASNMRMSYHQLNEEYAAALKVGRQVLERDPLFFPNRMAVGEVLRLQGDLAGAIQEQRKVLEQDSQNLYGLTYLARSYVDSGDLVKARQSLERIRPSDRRNYRGRRTWAILLALEGQRTAAIKEMDDDVLKWGALLAYETAEVAGFYAVLGEASKALDWLDQAVRRGDDRAEWFRRDPLLASVRAHPRFEQSLQSIAYRRQQRQVAK